jgi:hypothetical protein
MVEMDYQPTEIEPVPSLSPKALSTNRATRVNISITTLIIYKYKPIVEKSTGPSDSIRLS